MGVNNKDEEEKKELEKKKNKIKKIDGEKKQKCENKYDLTCTSISEEQF
jgi:hypothetical protein